MSVQQGDSNKGTTSVKISTAQLAEYLEELPNSTERKFAGAGNIQGDEFATVDIVNHLSQQEHLPEKLDELMEAPYQNGIDEILDKAVEEGYLERELKTIETAYSNERPMIYRLKNETII